MNTYLPSQQSNQTRNQIRHQMREVRHRLTTFEQQQAERCITEKALNLVEQHGCQTVALYLSFDSEISTESLIKKLWQEKINVTLPVLHPFSRGNLLFLKYQSDTIMQKNRYGILQPKLNVQNVVPLEQIDIIFTPLVAFDKNGNRIGMGGGFYDRTLQHWQQKSFLPVGLAHRCQQLDNLPTEIWDIPLAMVLTD
ncbi:5-formyltetrahydrofolate cyclo-ligase [Seminibacterium arietis]|uniref:5-formyltetrahydrofolate cyclo-ligase n=1 Tax=Seminibacterium arietis TaxID=1173502 RepID=A0ABW3I9B1_9PAST